MERLEKGDLPDWIASKSDLTSLTIAEAKGCHDRAGTAQALARAWAQAERIDVTASGRRLTVKRVAVATRCGVAAPTPVDAFMSVRDPEDEGDFIDPKTGTLPSYDFFGFMSRA
ncbi:hypothetical protein [Ciceribacter selenitireducens]